MRNPKDNMSEWEDMDKSGDEYTDTDSDVDLRKKYKIVGEEFLISKCGHCFKDQHQVVRHYYS